MSINGPRQDDLNLKVNTVVGIKQYRHIKKVMEEFESKFQQELERAPKVDQRIK